MEEEEPAKTTQHGAHRHWHCMRMRGWWVHTGPCVSGSTQLKDSFPNGLPESEMQGDGPLPGG